MFTAMVSTPTNGVYVVKCYYINGQGVWPNRQNHALPEFSIPCTSYEHARRVASAINDKPEV